MPVDAIVALVVIAIMFSILFGVIWWARGAPAYDDGRASSFVTYVAEPDDARQLHAQAGDEPGEEPGEESGEESGERDRPGPSGRHTPDG